MFASVVTQAPITYTHTYLLCSYDVGQLFAVLHHLFIPLVHKAASFLKKEAKKESKALWLPIVHAEEH